MAAIGNVFAWLFAFVVAVGILGVGSLGILVYQVSQGLPDHAQLADYQPPIMTRVHAGDGRVFAEYAIERRLFVPIDAMPQRLVDAFVSAEDRTFWTHPGISIPDILRAAVTNAQHWGQRRPVGASTITQQVAKNFLLSNEVSIERKIKEALVAMRIEEALPKRRILELYLNEIYLGFQAYGVASAGLMYFGKSLEELSLPEIAFLAALPKAPNNYNPQRYPERAKDRRDYVLGRMHEDGKITTAEFDQGKSTPLVVRNRAEALDTTRADYFAEDVRRELVARFGEETVYKGGLSVRTSMDPRTQRIVDEAIRKGMVAYDRRHGWRGAPANIAPGGGWQQRLHQAGKLPGLAPWQAAAVLSLANDRVEIGFADGARGIIPFEEMRWARRTLEDQRVGNPPRNPGEVVQPGDVVAVEPLPGEAQPKRYGLRQIPNVGAAVVALDPHTGRVLAMAGGWSFEGSQFNRATQAQRQPGSSFKPFVYLAALEAGLSPTTIILDAPVVVDQGPTEGIWKPSNYSREFYGPTPMRTGVELSRNLMTVRLAQNIGLEPVVRIARDFGINERMPPVLSAALGSVETTVLKLTAAYATIVNGGYRVTPTLIDRVQDRTGKTIYRADARACDTCLDSQWRSQPMPNLPDERTRVVDAMTAYQMVSFLEGVVERGTGTRAKGLGRPLAGKTGTSNDANDVWFVGFSPDLVVGVWFGFDSPRTLGGAETGGTVAVPVFRDVMAEALKDRPPTPFRVPPGIKLVRVDLGGGRGYTEAFKPGQEGGGSAMIGAWPGGTPASGGGGGGTPASGARPASSPPSLPGNSSSGGLY
ncbi:MAG: penicillin-binding protein 1A [Alphaproteobacteria bacterium]|nr:penicillin-binding protein 1A [Alphaproteobacteria bacterium]